ncbi:MAG: acyl-CoA/acyl-ACP dehydrogenase [Actinomycetota bacterium]|nr:acyl-CoA/acyl-ACP dehydrogenase [Actinomycetota bacterium]
MDFAFSEEQQMLREQARSFLAEKVPNERVAELATSDEYWDPSTWPAIAELGWLGLSVPEDQGGAGMGFLEEAVLFEESGYALYPGPYFATVGLALPALAHHADALARVIAGDAAATLAWAEPSGSGSLSDLDAVGTKAESSNGSWTLSGEKDRIPDAGLARLVVVTAATAEGPALFLVDDEVSPAVLTTVDSTRRLGRLELQGLSATLLAGPDEAPALVERIRLRALAAAALEAVGIAQKALELAVAHASERKQFDKPIGTYQAVSHQVANIYIETELARSLAYWAAWCVAEGDEQAAVAVAAAKSAAAEAAVAACERSIQVHGGIGFTWEHILHRYYKRAEWIDSFENFGSVQRAAIAGSLLDG